MARSLLELLAEDERRDVLRIARRRKFRKGEVIFHEGDLGDSLHIIEKGHVAVRMTTPLGDVATLTVLGPGEAFGELALLAEDSRRTATAAAIEATDTRTIDRNEFDRLRADHGRVERFLTEALAEQVRRLSTHLVEALYVPAETRVLRRLLQLGESYCGDLSHEGQGAVIVPITQDELATMAGTTRPTANRVLKSAQDRGLVELGRGKVSITDLGRLRQASH